MSIFDIFSKKKPLDAPWSKFYTKEEINYPIPDMTMYDEVKLSTKRYPLNIAIKYEGKKITYDRLLKKIDVIARGFNSLGIGKGDIVTIVLPNVPEALISLYALNKLGAIANMTHPLSAEEEIKETLISTKSKYLIIYDARYEKIANYIQNLGMKKVIFVSPSDSLNIFKRTIYNIKEYKNFIHHPSNQLFINWHRFLQSSYLKKDFVPKKYGKNTPAVILHSGGTSGKSKNFSIRSNDNNVSTKN